MARSTDDAKATIVSTAGRTLDFFALPAFLAIALLGLAVTHPAVSTLVSNAVQAEFVGIDPAPNVAPTQLAQPGMVTRTVRAN